MRTKILAILAVAAMALVPVFALIDSDDSSADTNVDVNDWNQFKSTMDEARALPENTFNVTVINGFEVESSITIPANVNLTINEGQVMSVEEPKNKTVIINNGNITLKPLETRSTYSFGGGITCIGTNTVFINRGNIDMGEDAGISVGDGFLVNYGTIVSNTRNFTIDNGTLTNSDDGTITINGERNGLFIRGDYRNPSYFVNRGLINGTGFLYLEDTKAVNVGGHIYVMHEEGLVVNETDYYNTNNAGKTISSEGYQLKLNTDQIDTALQMLGDVNLVTLVQNFLDSTVGTDKSDVDYVYADFALASYYCEADYPHNSVLRTAVFDVDIKVKTRMYIKVNLPAEGTYEYGSTPSLESRTLTVDANVTISGMLKIDAYFDAGNMLERVDIGFGLGIKMNAKTDVQFHTDDDGYTVKYTPTPYDLSASINVYAGLDFNGFDLMSYNPGDKWDVKGKIEIAKMFGEINLLSGFYTSELLQYRFHNDPSEQTQRMLEDLRGTLRTNIDLEELFETLFGPIPKTGSPVSSAIGAATMPTNDSAGGLFGNTFMFTAEAVMDANGNVILTRGPGSSGSVDIGDLLFTALEAEGEDSFSMSAKMNGDSMESFLAGATVLFTGMGTQEQAEDMLKSIGAEYKPSNISIADINKMYDKKMTEIDGMTGQSNDNSGLYIAIAIIASIAALIAMSMFIKKE